MDHALRRSPVDICRQRGEKKIILGNGAVVRVLRPGAAVTTVREGDLCLIIAFGTVDRYGYVQLVRGYDQPGSYGVLARRLPWPAKLLVPLPVGSRYSPLQWAASYLRYFTAWDNWKVAQACWRAQMPTDDEQPLVFGWGGGVVLGELELARRAGSLSVIIRTRLIGGVDDSRPYRRTRALSWWHDGQPDRLRGQIER